jgi:hypothetical protein
MSVRDKLVELAYVRWELRQRADTREPVDTLKGATHSGRQVYPAQRARQTQPQPLTSG